MFPRRHKGSTEHLAQQIDFPKYQYYSAPILRKHQGNFEALAMEDNPEGQMTFPNGTDIYDFRLKRNPDGSGYQKSTLYSSLDSNSVRDYHCEQSDAYDSTNETSSSTLAFNDLSNFGTLMTADPLAGFLPSYAAQDDSDIPWWPDSDNETVYANSEMPSVPFLSWDGIMDDIEMNPWASETEFISGEGASQNRQRTIDTEKQSSKFSAASGARIPENQHLILRSNDNSVLRPREAVVETCGSSSERRSASTRSRHKLPDRAIAPLAKRGNREIRKESVRPLIPRSVPYRQSRHASLSAVQQTESSPEYPLPKRIEPKPDRKDMLSNLGKRQQSPDASELERSRQKNNKAAKDEFLVRSKQAGMSYKDIKQQGRFTEPESTLRGRYRTLTKDKKDRVRKPEWNDNDIRLLEKAVRKLCEGSDPSKAKIPWKQVADYIFTHGGSYHFGNATCRKRWDELQCAGSA